MTRYAFGRFDPAGNLVSVGTGSYTVYYGYDPLNRLSAVSYQFESTQTAHYSYDAVGNLQTLTYPNGVVHNYSYDFKNRLTNLGITSGGATPTTIASYAYTVDAAGHRTSVAELSGRTVNYGYDNLYRLTSETIAHDPAGMNGAVSYTYDPVGNRTQKVSTLPGYPGSLSNYNANDQLATDTYDAEGNTTASNGNGYVYDFENHLIQANGITYTYDGDGNRIFKTVAGVTTSYWVDDQNPTGYAQVLTEQATHQTYAAQYVYGLEQIVRWRRFYDPYNNFVREHVYYEHDGHGSVRALTDGSGTVTDTYDYDAFGTLIHSTGTTQNNYLFAGEQFDPDLGLYFNRARYLNTSTGRFLTADSFEGDPLVPLALHKYSYVESDPIDHLDPSGHQIAVVISVAAALVVSLATIAYLHFTARPARIGLYWNNSFAWHDYFPGKRDPNARPDATAIKQNALDALRLAYAPFGALVSEGVAGGTGGHTIEVDNYLSAKGCGQTRTSPSHYSWIDYSCALSGAESALHSNDPKIVSPAVGRGIGNIGAHEVGHQLGLSIVNQDLNLPGKYDSGNSNDPSIYDGTGQVWTDTSKEELPGKIKPFI